MVSRGGSGLPIVTRRVKNPTSIHEDAGSIRGLPQGLRIRRCHELWSAAVAPIRPLAWEPPCATGMALKSKKCKCHKSYKSGGRARPLGNPTWMSFKFQLKCHSSRKLSPKSPPPLNTVMSCVNLFCGTCLVILQYN